VGKLVLGLVLSWKGILESLDYGQMEFFLFFLAVLGARVFLSHPFLAGVLLGLLPSLKLPWLFFFAPFFLKATQISKKFTWRLVSGYGLAVFSWSIGIPILLFGAERTWELTQAWRALLKAQPKALYASDINQSFFNLGLRWFSGDSPVDHQLLMAGVLLLSGAIFGLLWARSRKTPWSRSNLLGYLAPWMIFTQLLNPLAWRWGSVLLVGAPFAARPAASIKRKFLWALVGVLWALQQTPVVKVFGFVHWTDLHSYNLITLYWLVLVFL
jgi:hypothetical protein